MLNEHRKLLPLLAHKTEKLIAGLIKVGASRGIIYGKLCLVKHPGMIEFHDEWKLVEVAINTVTEVHTLEHCYETSSVYKVAAIILFT